MNDHLTTALSSLTTGLYLLTTGSKEEPHGMIASWIVQVGYDPPLIMAVVRTNRYIHELIAHFGCFGVNVLSSDHADFIGRFKKTPPTDRFKELELVFSTTGAPLLKSALAWLDSRLVETTRPGDHTLFLGRVEEAKVFGPSRPLTNLDYGHSYLGNY